MDFSVIIPAYNCESSIAKTVKSICDVQIEEMEIIIVDDGSTDNTSNECRSLAEQYPLVRYYYQENQGVSAARNTGISKAAGKYILFWDSDDKADTELLKKCMLTAKEKNADMLIFGMSFRNVYKGKTFHVENKQCAREEMIIQNDFPSVLEELFNINYLSSCCNKIFKREMRSHGSFNTQKKSFEDLLYVLEFLNYCGSIYIMPDLAYIYEIEYPLHKLSRLKTISDFDDYMQEFQNAVLRLEDTLDTRLFQLRSKLGLVYEWMLCGKLESSSYKELKRINANGMKVSLFDEQYEPTIKINRLFFERKLLKIRVMCIYKNIRSRFVVRLKVFLEKTS